MDNLTLRSSRPAPPGSLLTMAALAALVSPAPEARAVCTPVPKWTWDARLTSTALLFVIYLGYLLLRSVVEDPERAATYAAVLGIVGALDVPIIHFSVEWWRTLHQPATVLKPQAPSMDPAMLRALLLNVAAFLATFAYLAMRRYRLLTLQAEALSRAISDGR